MKKILAGLIIFIVLFLVSVYLLIPSTIEIRKSISVYCTKKGANSVLSDYTKWMQWWPDNKQKGFTLNNILYTPVIPANNTYSILMQRNNDSVKSSLLILPGEKDSTAISWSCTLSTGLNPITRLTNYYEAGSYADNIQLLLLQLKNFLEQTDKFAIETFCQRFAPVF